MKMDRQLCEVKGETLIVTLPDELDHDAAEQIRKCTDDLFIAKKIRNVIFDYGQTSFMDSSGIGLVMGRYREVRYLNGNVYIVGVNDRIRRILEISGLYRIARTKKDIRAALSETEMASGIPTT